MGSTTRTASEASVAKLETNWDDITAEVLELRSTKPTIVRTMDIYNPYIRTDIVSDTWQKYDCGMNDFEVFKLLFRPGQLSHRQHFLLQSAYHTPGCIWPSTGRNGYEDPKSKGYLSFDGIHPNNTGHRIIADELRKLGYAPLATIP